MEELEKIKNKIFSYLSVREYSAFELEIKLVRFFSQQKVSKAISQMQEKGYILTPEELRKRLKNQLDLKYKSYYYICQKLKSKKLPTYDFDFDEEFKKASYLLEKNKKKLKDKHKVFSYLKNRYFNQEVVERLVNEKFTN